MNTHSTPLKLHFKQKNFWFDLIILGLLWGASFYFSKFNLLKVITLMSTLDVIGFFVSHWATERKSFLLQGFLGGFVSSTGMFLKFTSSTWSHAHWKTLSQAMLLTTLAMLIECFLIIYTLHGNAAFLISTPLAVQMIGLCIALIFLHQKITPKQNSKDTFILNERPVLWMKVVQITLLIFALVWSIRLLKQYLTLNSAWSSFIVSFFEAHAVTAATLSEIDPHLQMSEAKWLLLLILSGNTLSKCMLVLRTKNNKLKTSMISVLILTLLFAWITFYI